MRTLIAISLLLGMVALIPGAEARLDKYETSTGASATAAYPDTVDDRGTLVITVNADAGLGTINAFPTAPTGWNFVGCAFVSVDVNTIGSTHKTQTVQLTMTGDMCSWYVEITWATALGTANAATTVQGTTHVEAPSWVDLEGYTDEESLLLLVLLALVLVAGLLKWWWTAAWCASFGFVGTLIAPYATGLYTPEPVAILLGLICTLGLDLVTINLLRRRDEKEGAGNGQG